MSGVVVLVRHGETAWSRDGRHTSRTDVPLTDLGQEQARALAPRLGDRPFVTVLTSPMQRARETARLAGLGDAVIDPDLLEWDYGDDEGRTTAEIRVDRPGWSVWDGGPARGEPIDSVAARADAVLARVDADLDRGDVAFVGHAHMSRVLAARWLGLDARAGRFLVLGAATTSELGHEREQPAILTWNVAGNVR